MFTPLMFRFTSMGVTCAHGWDCVAAKVMEENKVRVIIAGNRIKKNKKRGSEAE